MRYPRTLKMLFLINCSLAALNASATSETGVIHILQPGITIEVEFAPNIPQTFVNYLFWSVSGTCKVATPDPSNDMHIEILSGKGTVDGVPLSQGDSVNMTVQNADVFRLSAEGWSKVRIVNLGTSLLKATCST